MDTSRDYFKQNSEVAISLISKLKDDKSEYVRKSVGNSLKDISKKHGTFNITFNKYRIIQ